MTGFGLELMGGVVVSVVGVSHRNLRISEAPRVFKGGALRGRFLHLGPEAKHGCCVDGAPHKSRQVGQAWVACFGRGGERGEG